MNIYVAHARSFDFKKELYEPIRQRSLSDEHTFVLPHETSNEPFDSKEYLQHQADVVLAEVSEPSTGLGVELGWADIYGVPIVCLYRKGSRISGSLQVVSKNFVEYSNNKELISGIKLILNQI